MSCPRIPHFYNPWTFHNYSLFSLHPMLLLLVNTCCFYFFCPILPTILSQEGTQLLQVKMYEFWDEYFLCSPEIVYIYFQVHHWETPVEASKESLLYGESTCPHVRNSTLSYISHRQAGVIDKNIKLWWKQVQQKLELSRPSIHR